MRRRSLKLLIEIIISAIIFLIIITTVSITSFRNHEILKKLAQSYIKEPPAKEDWHDWPAMHIDRQRIGIGEQGKATTLKNEKDHILGEKSIQQHGLNAISTDAISINRSVPDARDKSCLYKKYLTKLHVILDKLVQNNIQVPPAKKDWHEWRAMYIDSQRIGIGEQGKAATLENEKDRILGEKSIQQHGLNAILSDAISINRSVLDARDKGCLYKKYLTKLPTVSIVITFHNEYLSTFLRTLHSLVNRTPPELLKEIILVDDFSDLEFFKKLEEYVTAHFDKVQFVRLPERRGLIRARLAGVRKMTAEVLVILDAHIEVNYNWLPPLLEPIALNKRTVVCPIIDLITAEELAYYAVTPSQGGFDWDLDYIQTAISPKDLRGSTEPYNNPIMMGGLFAMSVDYFWELGGYDDGLEIYGAEQFELSFKIWMCGGQLLDVPCSRVAHHFRGNLDKGLNVKDKTYKLRNKKRVAEVWMDEYKKYFYDRQGSAIAKIDTGDLTEQKALHKKLHCKSFKWFMNEIAVNILSEYPPVEPLEYASGAIQSVASTSLCIDALDETLPGLYECNGNPTLPIYSQFFLLRWSRDLRLHSSSTCLDVPEYRKNAQVILFPCHNQGGTQFWYYDRKNKWLVHGPNGRYCLEALPSNKTMFMNICEKDNLNMKWNFGAVNDTALDNFFENIKI